VSELDRSHIYLVVKRLLHPGCVQEYFRFEKLGPVKRPSGNPGWPTMSPR